MFKSFLPWLIIPTTLAACASSSDSYDPLQDFEQVSPAAAQVTPAPTATAYPPEAVQQGQYLVTLLGCANCHTDGALVGEPNDSRLMAGSEVGIAWTSPLEGSNPGVVYPANLTPDPETGLGDWSLEEIVAMLQTGIDNHGRGSLPVMPWIAYSRLKAEDARAIAMYLKSLPPVKHSVPRNVRPGQRATAPYVHFGIYQSKKWNQ